MKRKLYKGYLINEDGSIVGKRVNKMSFGLDRGGYNHISIYHKGKKTTEKVHRIIAKCFIENPHNFPCINHINGIKTDNCVKNLEWVTYSDNEKHAWKIGLMENNRKVVGLNGANHLIKILSKKVIDTNTGIIYNSATIAANALGINKNTLFHWLSGYRKNKSSLKYLNIN